jgi:hypothetical protein
MPVAGAVSSEVERAAPRPSDRTRDMIGILLVAAAFALPLRGLLRAQGPPMEEGFMLAFPELVLEGQIPNRDFLHLYGPGSLWALAGAFKVFGVSLWTERLFGLAQQLAIVFGLYALARPWGRRIAVLCGWTAVLVIVPFGLTALAWVGAVGIAVLGLVAGRSARFTPDDVHAQRRALGAGLLFGAALLFRIDLVVAVGLATFALCVGMGAARTKRVVLGVAIGVSPYLIHVITAGPGHVIQGMILDPVFELRGGRGLPLPPPWGRLDGFLQRAGALEQIGWPLPQPEASQQLFLWFFSLLAVVAFIAIVGFRAVRRSPDSLRARTILLVGAFSVGMLPQAIQRADSAHLAWVGCVPLGFLPVVLLYVARRRWPNVAVGRLSVASGALVLVALLFVIPGFTYRRYADYAAQTFDVHRTAHRIEHDGRVFYYGKEDRAAAAQQVIDAADAITKPGDRLFVGPSNLRKTPYSDAYLYYLLDKLEPATYFIEMDPGVANAEDSGLERDLASADVVILSSIWDDWSEPNDSRYDGSTKSEEVLARDFCLIDRYLDHYELYQRCS